MQQERFKYLMERLVGNSISEPEKSELRNLLNQQNDALLVETGVVAWLNEQINALSEDDIKEEAEKHLQMIFNADRLPAGSGQTNIPPVRRLPFLKKWGWAAAAIVILSGISLYFLLNTGRTGSTDDQIVSTAPEQILPGRESAMLSLADGTMVPLDSIRNGVLALQGGTTAKLVDGKLVYEGKANEILYNTIKTPKGGQYHLTLPDGSKVWLNAASSISFPVAFVEDARKVQVTGEAYFEIAANRSTPFILDVNGQSTVEVLGTSFNVNSYHSESVIRTTLLDGRVKIKSGNGSLLLQPGQQSVCYPGKDKIDISSKVDMQQVLAWKNGLFNFEGSDFPQLMRQLERWYDIEVRYEGEIPAVEFQGKMYRDVPLSDVLKVLEKAGVKFRMENRTIVIM